MAESFGFVSAPDARVLILGSMPGEASLAARQYYAHPRNSFWPVLCAVLGEKTVPAYQARLNLLRRRRIALWDVLKYCQRPGSADADIDMKSVLPNDFKRFFRNHAGIKTVFFNGAKAQECYRKYVLPELGPAAEGLSYIRLPSTSPAYAGMSAAEKTALWREEILAALKEGNRPI